LAALNALAHVFRAYNIYTVLMFARFKALSYTTSDCSQYFSL